MFNAAVDEVMKKCVLGHLFSQIVGHCVTVLLSLVKYSVPVNMLDLIQNCYGYGQCAARIRPEHTHTHTHIYIYIYMPDSTSHI